MRLRPGPRAREQVLRRVRVQVLAVAREALGVVRIELMDQAVAPVDDALALDDGDELVGAEGRRRRRRDLVRREVEGLARG